MQQRNRTYNLKPTNVSVRPPEQKVPNAGKNYAAKVERIEVPAAPMDVIQTIASSQIVVNTPIRKKHKRNKVAVMFNRASAFVQNAIVDVIKFLFLTGLVVRRLVAKLGHKMQGVGKWFMGAKHYFKWKASKGERKEEVLVSAELAVNNIATNAPGKSHHEVNAQSLLEKFIEVDKKLLTAFLVLTTGIPKAEVVYPINDQCRHKIFSAFSARAAKFYIPAACVVLIGSVLYSAKDYTVGVKAYIDGQEVAVMKSEEEYDTVFKRIGNYVSSISGQDYAVEVTPEFKMALVNKKEIGSYGVLEDLLLLKAEDIIHETNGLYVDGVLIASNQDRAALESVLTEILDQNKADNRKVEFIQDIRIENVIVPKDKEKQPSEIKDLLTATVAEESTYTVAKGDVLGTIAPKVDMTVDQLKAMNPSLQTGKLIAGEELVVARQKQYLAVKTMETIVYTESLPFKTEVVKDDSAYTYTTKVKQKGKAGEVEITAEVISIGGEQLSNNVVSRKVLAEPVTQIEVKGTKTPPPKSTTGKYVSPVSGGVVSSRYGVKRGSKYHTGLDIALPTGSTIVAADGGVVNFSGWSGGYGYTVKITHANGQETVYAHCSKLLVTKGQQVGKGEPIARVGSTGNSTGPHVHFEIRIGGKTVNPAPYIGR